MKLAPHKITGNQPLRFVVAGGINTVVGYLIYAAALFVGLAPELALAVATIIGIAFNYFSTGTFVFGYRLLDRLPHFVAVYGVVYALNAVALRALVNSGVHPLLAQAFLVPLAATGAFLGFRYLVFVRSERR